MNNKYCIEKIEIVAFGKLKNVVITPSEHINLISLPNESGKTTLAAFLKYVFYGFCGTKKQAVSENEKLRYMPWDGGPAKGAVVVLADGKRYRVERKTTGKDDAVSVTDTETGEAALKGQIPGVALFGINEDTFAKTLFMGRVGETRNGDPTLAESLRNLLFSTDDRTNADKAMKRLKESRAYLKNMQYRGLIPSLDDRRKKLEEALAEANNVHRELTAARVSLCDKKQITNKAKADLKRITEELENISCYEAGQKLDAIKTAREAYAAAQKKYESAREILGGENTPETRLIDTLADDNANLTLSNKRLQDLTAELTAEEASLNEIKASSPFFETNPDDAKRQAKLSKWCFHGFLAVGIILAAAALVLFLATGVLFHWMTAAIGGALCLIASAVFYIKGKMYASSIGFGSVNELIQKASEFAVIKEKAKNMQSRIDSLNRRYSEEAAENHRLAESVGKRVGEFMPGLEGSEGYSAAIRKIYAAAAEIGSCKAEWMNAAELYKKLSEGEDTAALAEKAKRALTPDRSRSEAERELAFTQSRLNALHSAVTELEKKCASLEASSQSPALLAAKLEVTERRLDEANAQYKALTLAMEVLEDACNYMKSTVSPKLAELTGGYLSMASGGKYDTVSLTANLEMTYDDNGMEHNADHLSDGARDTAYISMRFALVELLYDDNRPFVILDDSFCHLDDNRLNQMLRLICGLSEEQQIFIFSCRGREQAALEAMDAPYTVLSLGDGE